MQATPNHQEGRRDQTGSDTGSLQMLQQAREARGDQFRHSHVPRTIEFHLQSEIVTVQSPRGELDAGRGTKGVMTVVER